MSHKTNMQLLLSNINKILQLHLFWHQQLYDDIISKSKKRNLQVCILPIHILLVHVLQVCVLQVQSACY